jgi:TolB-like protein
MLRSKSISSAPSAASTVSEKSIAVLPFLNESGDPGDEYFSDGLSEELIAALAQIDDLKVIGRSSSFRFKGKNEESRTIGEKLGVNTLLEGTVRKQADHVRIVAELINAADGRELWLRTFDRALKDIFAVQEEIAEAVAGSLELTLLGREDKSARNASTQSVERTTHISRATFTSRAAISKTIARRSGFSMKRSGSIPTMRWLTRSARGLDLIGDLSNEKKKEAWATARSGCRRRWRLA